MVIIDGNWMVIGIGKNKLYKLKLENDNEKVIEVEHNSWPFWAFLSHFEHVFKERKFLI